MAACDVRLRDDLCGDAAGRCAAACFAAERCESLQSYVFDDAAPAPSLSRCLSGCPGSYACKDGTKIDMGWVCDGEKDCPSGDDEQGCTYFECDDGQLVRQGAQCDGYPHCVDESDEATCP